MRYGSLRNLRRFVRDLLAGRQGQPSARPWHLLIDPSGLQPFPPHRFSLILRLLPTLITISSSSIDSPVTYTRLAYSLPYTWASMPYTFNALRLSIEVLIEVLAEVLIEILAEILKVKASLVVYCLGSSVS